MSELDLVILGGGPGGSLTASLVLRQDPGRRVLVLEREKFPRHHVGESSIPSWKPILERAGVLPKLHERIPIRKVGGRFLWGRAENQSWTLDFRDKDGGVREASFHVDRAEFDDLLLKHAASLGAEVHEQATVTAVDRLPDGTFRVRWEEGGAAREVITRYVVDASGQARLLSRFWKIPLVPYDGMNNFAVWGYWKGSRIKAEGRPMGPGERWTLISTCDDGWVWHIPVAEDLVSVGVVTEADSLPSGGAGPLEAFYRRNVTTCPEVGELLEGAELSQHPRASSKIMTIRDWSYHCSSLSGEGWFLVGDAALFVDPILSTGMLITANGASMAANALHTLWNEPDVDRELLLSSYDQSYRESGMSFHRLAHIWYSRNFKRSTWHWEAKRQRLRTGKNPWAETSAEAFFQLCIGSFADPLGGAFTSPTAVTEVDRPDAHIMAAHLFSPEERAMLPGGVADGDIAHPETEAVAHEAVQRASAGRWEELLRSHVRVRGCTYRRDESYFTDRTMDRWTRVAYVEVRGEGVTDPFDRVVFPSFPELPESLLPKLDGKAPLRVVLRDAAQGLGDAERKERLAALRQQVLQLDFRGWLEVVQREPEQAAAVLPAAIAEAIGGWSYDFDPMSETLSLRLDADPEARVLLAAATPESRAFRKTATTRLWYPSKAAAPSALALIEVLTSRIRAWEAADPAAAKRFWERDVLSLAGAAR